MVSPRRTIGRAHERARQVLSHFSLAKISQPVLSEVACVRLGVCSEREMSGRSVGRSVGVFREPLFSRSLINFGLRAENVCGNNTVVPPTSSAWKRPQLFFSNSTKLRATRSNWKVIRGNALLRKCFKSVHRERSFAARAIAHCRFQLRNRLFSLTELTSRRDFYPLYVGIVPSKRGHICLG